MNERTLLPHVLDDQHGLVSECLRQDIFSSADIRNLYRGDGGKPATVTAHWYLVTEWLADELVAIGAPVLRNEFGSWWGYTGRGPLMRGAALLQKLAGGA